MLIAVPDAALRRLAQARTLRPESPPPEEPRALEPTTPRAMPRARRRTGLARQRPNLSADAALRLGAFLVEATSRYAPMSATTTCAA